VRPFARRDLPPLVERTYEMESWYEGELAGEGVVERVEEEIGKVLELSWMRSLMIRLENVFRLPTNMVLPSMK